MTAQAGIEGDPLRMLIEMGTVDTVYRERSEGSSTFSDSAGTTTRTTCWRGSPSCAASGW